MRNVIHTDFLYLKFGIVCFLAQEIGGKAALKMLAKLRLGEIGSTNLFLTSVKVHNCLSFENEERKTFNIS